MARVLIVDNEPPVREMLAEVLRTSGYHVLEARSGVEALELASALTPDLIMLDVHLPGFDGWATLEQLRATDSTVKVLMMSGSDYAAEALARGASSFLGKPYRPSEVLREVVRVLGEGVQRPSQAA